MERKLEEKLDKIMEREGVVGAMVVDKRGLCLSGNSSNNDFGGRRSATPNSRWSSSSSSTDEGEITGSPKKLKKAKSLHDVDVLSSSVQSASYNILFQIASRIFTFALNAFILRQVSREVLGICNVRLALLSSTIIFLSREPFRRVALRRKEGLVDWPALINLLWLSFPNTLIWTALIGLAWIHLLTPPEDPNYPAAVIWLLLSLILDSLAEVPYILGQVLMFSKLRIAGETAMILVRSSFLLFAALYSPSKCVLFYGIGSFFGSLALLLFYYSYFYYQMQKKTVPFSSLQQLLPTPNCTPLFPPHLAPLTLTFLQQGVVKQLLTEGERYLITFLHLLPFQEQGVYDLVCNLGSLAARFILLPVEEAAYHYFAQAVQPGSLKGPSPQVALVLGNLVKLMLMLGLILLTFGIPYSGTLLLMYGGKGLADEGTYLLQANCAYVLLLALNGVTEAFSLAVMTKEEMETFNRKLVLLSGAFLVSAGVFTKGMGAVGFFLANSLNMGLRIGQSWLLVRKVFSFGAVEPFQYWKLRMEVGIVFGVAFFLVHGGSILLWSHRILHVSFGLVIFGANCLAIWVWDKELLLFFVRMFKGKKD